MDLGQRIRAIIIFSTFSLGSFKSCFGGRFRIWNPGQPVFCTRGVLIILILGEGIPIVPGSDSGPQKSYA